ncbi:hypothetical protein KQ874_02160 [Mycoplasma sp. ES3157-GEN-MYC]|uniref:Uncharacterized protein n=1 Tax=Mycoplasma miroungigenitalium TaxID=754515 RepID=A0A6M4JC38_9MOLU|nr:hypothetical protein [Mycoplasma miroungigenitalium]MBU4690491.1 hypothetical protein [Mycoplasma miroungigenitalium]MBU4691758.1 hypothetical protein [Mycoplasma miroungigenitalium]QJR43586.1 hypothetical protein HLA87_02165 [Mycoplasma miroungigenitalium]
MKKNNNKTSSQSCLYKNKLNKLFLIFGLIVLITSLAFAIADAFTYTSSQDSYNGTPVISIVFKNVYAFFYFTYLTNFFLGITLLMFPHFKASHKFKKSFFMSIVLITVTFVIYWALISWNPKTWTEPYGAIRSLITHAINPILGFVALYLVRKEVTVNNKTIGILIGIVLAYFLFAFIVYFANYNVYQNNKGVVIYSFLDFVNPLFYKGGNVLLIIILDILMFVLGAIIPVVFSLFWIAVYRIKYTNNIYLKIHKKRHISKK